jgi:hypothetical protein
MRNELFCLFHSNLLILYLLDEVEFEVKLCVHVFHHINYTYINCHNFFNFFYGFTVWGTSHRSPVGENPCVSLREP